MGLVNDNLGVLYLGVAAGLYFKPEYAIYNSRLLTMFTLFLAVTMYKVLYQLILYPSFLTPLKHIKSPSVSCPCQCYLASANLTKSSRNGIGSVATQIRSSWKLRTQS